MATQNGASIDQLRRSLPRSKRSIVRSPCGHLGPRQGSPCWLHRMGLPPKHSIHLMVISRKWLRARSPDGAKRNPGSPSPRGNACQRGNAVAVSRSLPSPQRVSPRFTDHLPDVPCTLPRRTEPVHCRHPRFTFEVCSGFTRVTARAVAQPLYAAFVTRLRHGQLPARAARQLPDRSTPIWVDSASTCYPCPRGAHR
jgi:hypothetical protein